VAVKGENGNVNESPMTDERREYSAYSAFVDEMVGSASKSLWTQVLGGILLPLGLWLRGASIVAAGQTALYGTHGSLTTDPLIVSGVTAHLVGLIWLCGGALAHFHFFWPHRNRLVCAYGKTLSLVGGFVLLMVLIFRMVRG